VDALSCNGAAEQVAAADTRAAELHCSAFAEFIAPLKTRGAISDMKIYLDMCSLQRPLDTKTQPRIAVEAEAFWHSIAV